MQSVPITTNVVSSNPAHGEVYSIQHYMIKFVSDLQQVGNFLRVLRFPPPIHLIDIIVQDITEILLKVALNPLTQTGFSLLKLHTRIMVIVFPQLYFVHFQSRNSCLNNIVLKMALNINNSYLQLYGKHYNINSSS